MLTKDQIRNWLNSPESELLERKASIVPRDKICQAICAFSNDLAQSNEPGVVIIGQN